MTPGIQQSFNKLERQKDAVLSAVSAWSAERVRFRPDANSWSALDVLDHLVKVETAFLHEVRRNLPDGHGVVVKDRLMAWVVIGVMQSPLRVKVPAAVAMVLPQTTASRAEIAARWTETRAEIAALLGGLQPPQLRTGLFRHPVSGWMTMPRALTFLSSHLRHHDYQLQRLKAAAGNF